MSLFETFQQTIAKEKLITPGETVIVGVSGGADSVCLLHLLTQLKKPLLLQIIVSHINHKLRGKESDKDEQFVKTLCKKWKLKFVSKSVDIPKFKKPGKSSIEEIGREYRYQQFQSLAKRYNATKVILAHHADDQAETVLMRLLRGSGPEGLSGMRLRRPLVSPSLQNPETYPFQTVYLIRPLLGITRVEIMDYLKENKLTYREDSSNQEISYMRNRIRHKLIPYLEKEFNPQIKNALSRTSQIFAEEEEYWDMFLTYYLKSLDIPIQKNALQFPLDSLKSSPTAMQRRLLRYLLEKTQGHLQQIDYSHIDSILEMIEQPEKESTIQLPGEYSVSIKNNYLSIHPKTRQLNKLKKMYPLKIPTNIILSELGKRITVDKIPVTQKLYKEIVKGKISSTVAYLDFDKIKGLLKIRAWRPGDTFVPLGMKGQKKLQDFFIDRKIALEDRHSIPILCDNSKILWVIGYQLSDSAKVDSSTYTLLHLEIT